MRTILVVDDERDILSLIETALSREGHTALLANSGDAALELFQRSQIPIDLLLTDVVMPGMSGPMLADRLLSIQPGLPVLFISGYDDSQVVQRYVLNKGFAFLPKPFDVVALCRKVNELLPAPPIGNKSQTA